MSSTVRSKAHDTPPAAAMKTARVATDAPAARYEQVKNHIRQIIESGERQAGDRLPSELDLVATLGVSRMTVNRALRE
ncbi:MAG: GntR family transcriptional regulator, partial [Paraburkholderia nemoris]